MAVITRQRLLQAIVLLLLFLLLPLQARPQDADAPAPGGVSVLRIDSAIGPAVGDYIQRGIEEAEETGDVLVVLAMDTPGGLDRAMRDIIQTILDADIPVASYVAPQGARAASAGTYILYASHIAAMAPATNLGAATPVQIGAPGSPTGGGDDAEEDESGEGEAGQDGSSASERKMVNDARAYIRGLAERNGRNAEWAERAVTEAASLSASEALAENVIDLIAADVDELLRLLHGRELQIKGRDVVLDTRDLAVRHREPDARTRFLQVITDPNLILILGMIGIYGLIIEFYNPGFGFAGITGAVCLLLAGYGLQLLPLNYAGLGLILLGLVLMVAEALVPSFGILGVGGVVSFVMGAVILVDTEMDVFRVSLPVVAAVAVFGAGLLAITVRLFMKIRQRQVVSGAHTLEGQRGVSMGDFDRRGQVKVQGEIWTATSDEPLGAGDTVEVVKVDGLHLQVKKVS